MLKVGVQLLWHFVGDPEGLPSRCLADRAVETVCL